jgi:hypothetical protein
MQLAVGRAWLTAAFLLPRSDHPWRRPRKFFLLLREGAIFERRLGVERLKWESQGGCR